MRKKLQQNRHYPNHKVVQINCWMASFESKTIYALARHFRQVNRRKNWSRSIMVFFLSFCRYQYSQILQSLSYKLIILILEFSAWKNFLLGRSRTHLGPSIPKLRHNCYYRDIFFNFDYVLVYFWNVAEYLAKYLNLEFSQV